MVVHPMAVVHWLLLLSLLSLPQHDQHLWCQWPLVG
jgi:hypothetical protein